MEVNLSTMKTSLVLAKKFANKIKLCRFSLAALLMLAACVGIYGAFLAQLWTHPPTGSRSNSGEIPLPPLDDKYVRDCITNEVLGNVQRCRVSMKPFSRRSSASTQLNYETTVEHSFGRSILIGPGAPHSRRDLVRRSNSLLARVRWSASSSNVSSGN